MNKKFRAINNYLTNYDYNSFYSSQKTHWKNNKLL